MEVPWHAAALSLNPPLSPILRGEKNEAAQPTISANLHRSDSPGSPSTHPPSSPRLLWLRDGGALLADEARVTRYTYDWLPVDLGAELAVAPDRVARWGSESGVYIFDIDSEAPLCHWEDEGQFLNHPVPIIADGVLYVPGEEELFALRLP